MSTAQLYRMPRALRIVASDGTLTREGHAYLSAIEDVSGRVAQSVATTAAVNVAAVDAKVNAVIAALQAAHLMRTP